MKRKNEAEADLRPKIFLGTGTLNQAKRWGGWVGKKEKEKEITS
jgi:hypothetical protein